VANLSQLKEAERTVGSIFAKEGDAIDGIVLNAGVSMGKPFHKSTRSGRELEANLNYHSPAIFLQHALEKFAARTGKGRILVVSSLTALLPFPTNASYAASKAAFYHLLRSVRLEEAGKNVEFSAVLPGLTATQMSAGFDSILPRSSPKDVAAALFECWSKPQFPKIVGNLNRLAGVFGRLQPKLFDQMTGALQRWLPHE
jgi:short-subunit dehydrogenase